MRQPPCARSAFGKGVAKDGAVRLTRDDLRRSELRRRMLDDAGNQQRPFHHESRLQHQRSPLHPSDTLIICRSARRRVRRPVTPSMLVPVMHVRIAGVLLQRLVEQLVTPAPAKPKPFVEEARTYIVDPPTAATPPTVASPLAIYCCPAPASARPAPPATCPTT